MIIVTYNLIFCEKISNYTKIFNLQKICSFEKKTNPKFGFSAPKPVENKCLNQCKKILFPSEILPVKNFQRTIKIFNIHQSNKKTLGV